MTKSVIKSKSACARRRQSKRDENRIRGGTERGLSLTHPHALVMKGLIKVNK